MTIDQTAQANLRPFESQFGHHLFVADGSRIFDIEQATAEALTVMLDQDAEVVWQSMGFEGSPVGRWIDGRVPSPPTPRSLSLNVAQMCNLGCGYCYADGGTFGGAPRMMDTAVAKGAVDLLFEEAESGADLVIGFMGGEPLIARTLIAEVAEYSTRRGATTGHNVRFSITTNGTLLTDDDARLLCAYPFAVQFSLDGAHRLHDAQRPTKSGRGSYERAMRGLERITRNERPLQLTARATITGRTGELLPVLDHLIGLPFDDVGFALAITAPSGHAIGPDDFPRILDEMIECGRKAQSEMACGRTYPFSNFITAMEQIHRGTHRPYPCGAGAAYLSVNAEGSAFACHRTVDDPAFAMGDLRGGLDHAARRRLLADNNVDHIDPCRSCWARYLCGGGCYHEVAKRGRPGCDYIRGWLEFCLRAYVELSTVRPEGYANSRLVPTPAFLGASDV
jgi:uncharacterized protein